MSEVDARRQAFRDAYHKNLERKRAQARASYHKNKNKNKPAVALRREAHRQKACKTSAKWRADHKDLLMTEASRDYHRKAVRVWQRSQRGRSWKKNYAEKHPEQVYGYTKKWRSKNWERYMASVKRNWERWRALKSGCAVSDFTTKQWKEIKDLYLHSCAYCRRYSERLTQDHVIPLTKGGNHTAGNIVPACQSCNSKKSNRLVMKPLDPPKESEVIYG